MKKLLTTLLSPAMTGILYTINILIVFSLFPISTYAVTIKVASETTSEPLPFSILRITDVGIWRTDSLGKVSLNNSLIQNNRLYISSFGHKTKEILIPQDIPDTLEIRLEESPTVLQEVISSPLKKDKDIVLGRQTLNMGFFNCAEFNIDQSYARDSLTGRIYENELGIEINTPHGKLNRLKTFGINVVPTESMIEELTFILEIYDMTKPPTDSLSIPDLAYPPIRIKYDSSQVNRKKKEFRYDFPEAIDLPKDCIIIVSLTWYDENGESNLKGTRLRALTRNTGLFYKEGNPYKLAFPPFLTKKLPSPFFWEYTRYHVNDGEQPTNAS